MSVETITTTVYPMNEGVIAGAVPRTHFIVIYTNAALACMLNSLLLYLIKTTVTCIGSYRNLLSVMAIFNMSYAVIHVIVAPFVLVKGHMGVLTPTGVFASGPVIGYAFTLLYCSLFGQSLMVLMYHFLYRYIAVCRHHLLDLLHQQKTICFCIVAYILVAATWAVIVAFLLNDDAARHLLANYVWIKLGIDVNQTGMVAVAFMYPSASGSVIRPRPWIGSLLDHVLMTISFSIMTFCAISIQRKLRKWQAVSTHNFHKLQVQLYRALIVQTMVPLVLEYCACFFILFIPMSGLSIDADFTILCISAYPVVEPLVVIYFVRDYRIAMAKKLHVWKPPVVMISSLTPLDTTTESYLQK